MNKLVEEEIENCIACQSLTPPKLPQIYCFNKNTIKSLGNYKHGLFRTITN